jgi:hypothetical protein
MRAARAARIPSRIRLGLTAIQEDTAPVKQQHRHRCQSAHEDRRDEEHRHRVPGRSVVGQWQQQHLHQRNGDEFQTIRIGTAQAQTFIARINTASVSDAQAMTATTTGHLGAIKSFALGGEQIMCSRHETAAVFLTAYTAGSTVVMLGGHLKGEAAMFLADVLEGVQGRRGRVGTFSAFVVLPALVLFAYASPADPVWIAGIHDAADLDDAVQAAMSLESQVQEGLYIISPVLAIEGIMPRTGSARYPANSRGTEERGPPKS